MKLYENLPAGVTVDGRFYKLDFDFRNVLRMMETLDNDDLVPEAREYLAVKCLTKHPRNVKKVLAAIRVLLFGAPKPGAAAEKQQGEKVMSYEQDAGLIRTAFRQVYGIDLFRAKLHWFEFTELLRNMPEGNRYAEIISIRCRPIPAPTKYNAKEREWLVQAKAQCALHMTEKEAAKKYNRDVFNAFTGLLNMIPKDVKHDGK